MHHKGLFRRYQSLITVIQQFLDIFIIGLGLYLVSLLFNVSWSTYYNNAAITSSLLYYFTARNNRLYASWRGQPMMSEVKTVIKLWITVILAMLCIAFAFKVSEEYSRKVMLIWMVLIPSILVSIRVLFRLTLRKARSSGYNSRSIVIAGAGPLGITLARNIMATPYMGYHVVGFYDDKLAPNEMPDQDLAIKVLGDLNQLSIDARNCEYDDVYIALPARAEKRMKALIKDLSDSSVSVQYLPDIFTFNLINSHIKDIGGLPVISVYSSPLDSLGRLLKRAEDIILSSLILCLISLPMILISIAIKLTSKGPIFFKQKRYGLNGEQILVWKFRSMTVCEDGGDVKQATKNDSRITPIGGFLRKTSLDELPQFINVMQGSMSIVGPRPHAVAHNEQYRKEIDGYMQRHMVKPGITGWAQVNGWRGETDTLDKMEKRIEHDMHYIRNWSLWMDFKIIFLTIFKGFINKNAY